MLKLEGRMGLGLQDLMGQGQRQFISQAHEPDGVLGKEGAWLGGRGQGTVVRWPRPRSGKWDGER